MEQTLELLVGQDAGKFLHHEPALASKPVKPEATRNFKQAYQATFGDLPKIWGKIAEDGYSTSCTSPSSCSGGGADCGDGGSAFNNN